MKLFKRTKKQVIEFCNRCGRVCDAACRRAAVIERVRDRALLAGGRW